MDTLPAPGHRVGVSPRTQADEIAVVPVIGLVDIPVADVDHGDNVRKAAVRRKILINGHHLVRGIGAFSLLVPEPELVADMHTEPRSLRARESHAVGLCQCL